MSVDVDLEAAFAGVAETEPLVECITNDVTVNDVANAVLHWGGLPVMSDSPNDAPAMAAGADGLLLNMGTVTEAGIDTAVAGGEAATEAGAPIVVDPVGVGATPARDAAAERLVTELDVTVIKGNYGEVTALAGETADVRGVESVGEYDDIGETARAVADATDAVVVASGETDVVATADRTVKVRAGDPLLGEFVGSGCMLGATVAVFAASVDDPLEAALAATLAYGRAGERAAAGEYGEFHGPASYRVAFLDATAGVNAATVATVDDRLTELDR